jgi:type IV secretion system protein VirD4
MTSRQETAPLFRASGAVMQLPPGDELVLASDVAPIRAHKARCFEDRRLSSRAPPPPALTLPGAGASGDRPDLPADDWTAPSLTAPVAAAAIGSVVGTPGAERADMPNSRGSRKSKHEANARSPAKQVQP